jgi:hypothetical protein
VKAAVRVAFDEPPGSSGLSIHALSSGKPAWGKRDCIDCSYLALCHGGCPVRTYSLRGTLFEKDPYCELYKKLFRHIEDHATRLAGTGALNPQTTSQDAEIVGS